MKNCQLSEFSETYGVSIGWRKDVVNWCLDFATVGMIFITIYSLKFFLICCRFLTAFALNEIHHHYYYLKVVFSVSRIYY